MKANRGCEGLRGGCGQVLEHTVTGTYLECLATWVAKWGNWVVFVDTLQTQRLPCFCGFQKKLVYYEGSKSSSCQLSGTLQNGEMGIPFSLSVVHFICCLLSAQQCACVMTRHRA